MARTLGEHFGYLSDRVKVDKYQATLGRLVRPRRVVLDLARGRAWQIVLSYCGGQRRIAEIQELVERDHPALFARKQVAASFIMRVLARDTSE